MHPLKDIKTIAPGVLFVLVGIFGLIAELLYIGHATGFLTQTAQTPPKIITIEGRIHKAANCQHGMCYKINEIPVALVNVSGKLQGYRTLISSSVAPATQTMRKSNKKTVPVLFARRSYFLSMSAGETDFSLYAGKYVKMTGQAKTKNNNFRYLSVDSITLLKNIVKTTPGPVTAPPVVSCIPRPPCLDAIPRCLPPEPIEGWCPITPPLQACPTPPVCPGGNVIFGDPPPGISCPVYQCSPTQTGGSQSNTKLGQSGSTMPVGGAANGNYPQIPPTATTIDPDTVTDILTDPTTIFVSAIDDTFTGSDDMNFDLLFPY